MHRLVGIIALMFCACTQAQDASLVGVWQFNTRELSQRFELLANGSYRRDVVSATNRRTEVGRWHSDVSVLILQPDHVITAQGARVPLPPRETMIDVAGVDARTMTLYYDGDALETWQRYEELPSAPATVAAAAQAPDAISRQHPRKIVLHAPALNFAEPEIERPEMPLYLDEYVHSARPATIHALQLTFAEPRIETPQPPLYLDEYVPATRHVTFREVDVPSAIPITTPAPPALEMVETQTAPTNAETAVPAAKPISATTPVNAATAANAVMTTSVIAPAGLYDEQQVAELITQLACEQLRFPQRSSASEAARYQQMAIDVGMTPFNATRLARTLRYYQSNLAFMQKHQPEIAQRSMACVLEPQQVSVRE